MPAGPGFFQSDNQPKQSGDDWVDAVSTVLAKMDEQARARAPKQPLSPLAQSIVETFRRVPVPGRNSVSVDDLVRRDCEALAKLSDDERREVMREVNDAVGFELMKEKPPSAPARFLGKKEPRLSDLLLMVRTITKLAAREQNDIRQAEKFVFDNDAIEKAVAAVKALSHEDLSLVVSELRFPFRLCWFETPFIDYDLIGGALLILPP
jgi:hypothetical protein